ncbi:MAG: deoxyribodipyrimidine photo-lyase [Chloroflexi bacterium OHK40]
MAPIVHWFRRDLRLSDNTALAAAAQASGGAVVPLYILDDAILFGRWASPGRTAFLLASLRALDQALRERGSRLILRRGEPLRELLDVARTSGAAGVYWNRDYTPYAVARDTAVKAELRAAGLEARSYKDAVIFEMDEVVTRDGRPYTVYTPYARSWRQRLAAEGIVGAAAPALAAPGQWPAGEAIPELHTFGMALPHPLPAAGEVAAAEGLARFAALRAGAGIGAYAERRDQPGIDGTSRLSPHLRLGSLSPRQCLRAIAACRLQLESGRLPTKTTAGSLLSGIETWEGELIWRDFYVQVLYHHPYVLRGAFRREYDGLAWENDAELFVAWTEGRTGYPIVDAGMRQLRQEGWMHNRVRMIVASFLTKDLLVDWRWGEAHFMRHLLDGDPAANNGGWQWAAGTGTDAQPYFRIFNPTSQGKRFDPDGAYVRRYVPELANVPSRFVHEPHLMAPAEQVRADVHIGRDYPLPVVDHKVQRERALALYGAVRGG